MALLARLFPASRFARPAAPLPGRRRPRARGRAAASRQPSLAAEPLEPRALLAVTAALVGGDLVIAYNDPGDLDAEISSDGTNYTVEGTGLASKTFTIADVTGVIKVSDEAGLFGQQFKVLAGTALANPLQVDANVEATLLSGGITATTAGDVLIGSAAITLANDISTAATNGNVTLLGATTLTNAVSINTGAGAGNILFSGTLNGTTAGAQTLALTAGTGNVTFTGAVGGGTPLAGISLASAESVTAASTIALDARSPSRPTASRLPRA